MKNIQVAAFADEGGSPLEKQIDTLHRNNISLLEIRVVNKVNISKIMPEEAKEIRRQLDDNGIKTWSIGSPTGKSSINEPFTPYFDKFKRQLELANILGATRYRMFSFYDAYDSFDAVCERIGQMVEAAADSGVTLCHENEKEIYGDTAARCEQLLRAVPQLRAVYDPANFLQCGQPTLPAWDVLAPYVDYMHIKDCREDGKVVPPGDGVGNLSELLRRFSAQGGGVVTLEPHLSAFVGLEALERNNVTKMAYSYPDKAAAFDAAAAALRKLLAQID